LPVSPIGPLQVRLSESESLITAYRSHGYMLGERGVA
jgi:hypothetical protein